MRESDDDLVATELDPESGLRPQALDEFVGQGELKEHLNIVLEAARKRGQSVDHLLFAGPPGLGKTTLAGIIATEMGVHLHVTSGPALERAGDLAAILTKLEDGDVLVHRRDPPPVAGGRGDPVSGDGGLPARHRRRQGSGRVEYPADDAAVHARRCHDPDRHDHRAAARPLRARRPARLLRHRRTADDRRAGGRHLRDRDRHRRRRSRSLGDRAARPGSRTACCGVSATSPRCAPTVRSPPTSRARGWRCSVSTTAGSTRSTVRSSPTCASSSAAARSGLSTLAISVGEQPETVEDVYEPFLITQGMIARTPRGRVALAAAYEHVGLRPPSGDRSSEQRLFDA